MTDKVISEFAHPWPAEQEQWYPPASVPALTVEHFAV